jgi:uncharacterized protein YjbI with pentapeptide repeats
MKFWQIFVTASLIATPPVMAQNGDSSASQAGKTVYSCATQVGPLGATFDMSAAIDGKTLDDPADIKSLRSKMKDGRPIIIKGGDFSGKKFGSDNFSNICFVGSKLTNTRWIKSRAPGVAFIDSDLTGSTFDRVNMDYALFRNSILTKVDASGAQLSYGQLDGGWEPSMAGLRLDNTQMVGFKFVCGTTSRDGCSFDRKQLSLRAANLTNASIATFPMWDVSLDDVLLSNTEIAFDQIPSFSLARINGPVIVRTANRLIPLDADAFRTAAGAIEAAKANDTECLAPDTALSQILCQAGRSDLKAYRDDVNRLYENSIAAMTAAKGNAINVTGPSKAQASYNKALNRCVLRDDEEKAVGCLMQNMVKRRAALVGTLTKLRPLEQEARALYVSVQTPYLQTILRNPQLTKLTPFIVDNAPNMLLAIRDESSRVVARGFAPGIGGQRCSASFVPPSGKRTKKGNPAFNAWASGAEFTIGSPSKKKRKLKKSQRGAMDAVVAAPNAGCSATIYSGPLIRVPIAEDDFDRLWTTQAA